MEDWIDYLKNEEAKQVISNDGGLIAFVINGKELFVSDFYIKRDKRGKGFGLDLYKNLIRCAEFNECRIVTCNIFINDRNKEWFAEKVRLFCANGFVPDKAHNNAITLIKEL